MFGIATAVNTLAEFSENSVFYNYIATMQLSSGW